MSENHKIDITENMKRSFNRKTRNRAIICTTIYGIPFTAASVSILKAYPSFGAGISISVCIFLYAIVTIIFHEIFIAPRIWRHKVDLTEKQFMLLGGKIINLPPEKFSDIFKSNGELDFDYVINEYNGIRLVTFKNSGPYSVRFRRKEDATWFKLSIPHES